MRKFFGRILTASLLFTIIFTPLSATRAADFKREVIYQIITDRFFDGSSTNNNPAQSAGLYDSTKTNWRLLGRRPARYSTEDVVPRGHGRHRDLDLPTCR